MVHKIKELCKEQGITRAELCRRAAVEYTALRRWDIHAPNVYAVYRVAQVLNTTVENLIKE